MFWIFILAILAVAYIDNVLAFLKNVISFLSERPNLLCVFTTVILSVFLIVGFYFMISSSIDTDDGFQNEMVEKNYLTQLKFLWQFLLQLRLAVLLMRKR